MALKVKGLLKALGISQMFEEEKEPEMQIGLPTDVKHVAHIGWDGPSVENPSWMKEFKEPGKFHTAPLGPPLDSIDHPDNKSCVSEDADANQKYKNANSSLPDDQPEVSKTSRRHSSSSETGSGSTSSPKKSRSSRRNKESSDGSSKTSRHSRPGSGGAGSDSPARDLPDIPKKTRRKKSKEDGGAGSGSSTRTSKAKGTSSSGTSQMDPGPDTGCDSSILSSRNSEIEKQEHTME